MKKKCRKCTMTAGLMILMAAALWGCAGTRKAGETNASSCQTQEPEEETGQTDQSGEQETNTDAGAAAEAEQGPKARPNEEGGINDTCDVNDTDSLNGEDGITPADAPDLPAGSNMESGQETTIIGGKTRSIGQDSFVLSRVLMSEDDSVVVIPQPGSSQEQLVTVRCTPSTTFEHWTIQGGGAGIEKKEAAFSDIREDCGLEAFGCFDGEEFVADKVIIEVYE